MMSKDDPIFPVSPEIARTMALPYDVHPGLTKREYFAILALVGLAAYPGLPKQTSKQMAVRALGLADALIDALNTSAA